MYKFVLIPFLFFAIPTLAQYRLNATAGVSIVSAQLLNPSDKSAPNYATGSTKRHWNFTPNYSLAIGWHNTKMKGFQGLDLGFSLNNYLQHYDAAVNISTGNAFSELHYYAIPLTVSFGLGKLFNSYSCFAEVGGYFAQLQDYTEYCYSSTVFGVYEETSVHNYDLQFHESMLVNPNGSTRLKYWIYQKYDGGLLGALGLRRNLSPSFSFSMKLHLAYSLVPDIENKDVTHFWDAYAPKGYLPDNGISYTEREKTKLLVPGLQLACTYTFKPLKNEKNR
ncbi:MAG: hypothetical protein JST36_08335 [Bacteroidetes bacterium]|nr:hypothetical protein [Bacteroidota bacterium]